MIESRQCKVCNNRFEVERQRRDKFCGAPCRRIHNREYQRQWGAEQRAARPKTIGVVYAVTDGQYVKIGWSGTGDMEKRLAGLQVGNPRKLSLVAEKAGTLDREADLHYTVRQHRYRGEWFTMDCLPTVRKALLRHGRSPR